MSHIAATKAICAIVLLAATGESASAQSVPLPRPRPPMAGVATPQESPQTDDIPQPSTCRLRLTAELAVAPSLPPISGPGECGAPDVVRLEAVFLADKARVPLMPPAMLRCSMAAAIVDWVREQAAPRVLELGSALRAIENFDSYDCRGRNRVAGAKISEHGKGNALDIRALRLANGQRIELTDPQVPHSFRAGLRESVCARFTTVLGPGSDGYHENHVHVDLAERRGGYRLCQWALHDPEEARAAEVARSVPLPPPRPKVEERSGRKL